MKIIFFAFFLSILSPNLFAEEFFNSRMTQEEISRIENGEIYFKSIGRLRKNHVNRTKQTSQAIETIRTLNPNHLSEIISIRPYKGNENLIEQISTILGDVKNYIGIPYFSERNQKWYDLYSDAEILSIREENGRTIIDEKFVMEPFGCYTSEIQIENRGDYYFFTMVNTQKLRYYDRFNAVGKGKMMAAISVFREDDRWIIYALGGADIIKIPFLEKRAETSFTNRIKAFAFFIFQKLQELQSQDLETQSGRQ